MAEQTQLGDRLCIRGGRVIDPLAGIDEISDVLIVDGKIAQVGPGLSDGVPCLDASGKLVLPGLIDLHAHVYVGMSSYGLDPDRAGAHAGVAHVNDVGSTGWITFHGFHHHVVRRAKTPVTCFPNMLSIGLPENWAMGATLLADESFFPDLLAEHALGHPNVIRGVKTWVERGFMSNLEHDWRAFDAARRVTDVASINLYVHLGDLWPKREGRSLQDVEDLRIAVVERMRPGEVLGHCFTQFAGGLVDEEGRVSRAALLANEKGVLHEVGHGLNFSVARARRFLDAGLPVDIISSDVHGHMHAGRPRPERGLEPDSGSELDWSMLGTMSKCLALGIPLVEVIRAATLTPARAIGIDGIKGTLKPGFEASVSIVDLVPGDFRLRDSLGEELRARHLFLPAYTIIGSELWRCRPFALPEFRNEYLRHNHDELSALVS